MKIWIFFLVPSDFSDFCLSSMDEGHDRGQFYVLNSILTHKGGEDMQFVNLESYLGLLFLAL